MDMIAHKNTCNLDMHGPFIYQECSNLRRYKVLDLFNRAFAHHGR